jgi:hypothetical protein
MNPIKFAAAAAALSLVAASGASAQIMVDDDLGTLSLGSTVSRSGTTVGATNDASNYLNANDALIWGGDLVYELDLASSGLLSLTSDDDNAAPGDLDFFLLTGLSVVAGEAQDVFGGQFGPLIETSGDFGFVPAGTYFLAVDSFLGDGTVDGEGAFSFDLTLSEFIPPTPPPATDVVLDAAGSVSTSVAADEILFYEFVFDGTTGTIDTFGSDFDTELGLFDVSGALVANNDDAGGTLQSELILDGFAAGTYYLAVGGFNTEFDDGFSAVPGAFGSDGGSLILNGVVIPEPTSLALLGMGGLAALRRRRA